MNLFLKYLTAVLILSLLICDANAKDYKKIEHVQFPNRASLTFSSPTMNAENASEVLDWKVLIYTKADGEEIQLFPDEEYSFGGVIYENPVPRLSPNGNYAMLGISRTGFVGDGSLDGWKGVNRGYCPILDTRTGCIVSNQYGEICGGDWEEHQDRWIDSGGDKDGTTWAMLHYEIDDANHLWKEYTEVKNQPKHYLLKEVLIDNLGISNIMACDPPNPDNIAAYKNIAAELSKDGKIKDAQYIIKKLRGIKSSTAEIRQVLPEKAFLSDRPDSTSQTQMYLIQGDRVKILYTVGEEWTKIKYQRKNGPAIRKWIRTESLGKEAS